MKRDKRYATIKILVDTGHITEFRQFFDQIPPTVVKDDLGTNFNRLKRLISHVEEFSLKELFRIGEFCGIEKEKMLALAYNQIRKDEEKKQKGRKQRP